MTSAVKTAASISISKNLGGRGGEATCVAMRKSVHTDLGGKGGG